MSSQTAGEPAEATDASAAQRDRDIVDCIRSGSLNQAFQLVMERYETKVYRLCVAYVRNPAQAQDAAQESLVRLWRALPNYDGRAALSTWIYAITRNWCLTVLGKRRVTASLSEPSVQAEIDFIAAPDEQDTRDRHEMLRQLVAELPEITQRIVTLYYFQEQSVNDVSELVGLPEGTVKTHLFRARGRLLARLESLGLANPGNWLGAGN